MHDESDEVGCSRCLMQGKPDPPSARPLSQYPGFKQARWTPPSLIKEGTNHVVFCEACKTVWSVKYHPREYQLFETASIPGRLLRMLGADAASDDFIEFLFSDDYASPARRSAVLLAGDAFFRLGSYSVPYAANRILTAIRSEDILSQQVHELLRFFFLLIRRTSKLSLDSIGPILDLQTRNDIFEDSNPVAIGYCRVRLTSQLRDICAAGFPSARDVLIVPAEEKARLWDLTDKGHILREALQMLHTIERSGLEERLEDIIFSVVQIETNIDYIRRISEKNYRLLKTVLKQLVPLKEQQENLSHPIVSAWFQLSELVNRIECVGNLIEP